MYEARLTKQFIRATKKEDSDLLKTAISEILTNPYFARGSHAISYEWAGFRAADFIKGKRIIYRICEECVKNHQEEIRPFSCCSQTEATKLIVIFVDFGDYHASAGRIRLRPVNSYEISEPQTDSSTSETLPIETDLST